MAEDEAVGAGYIVGVYFWYAEEVVSVTIGQVRVSVVPSGFVMVTL